MKSQSGTKLDIPKHKSLRKSKQRLIKQFETKINWGKLSHTFMGGLFEYNHNNNNIKSELLLLENLHH